MCAQRQGEGKRSGSAIKQHELICAADRGMYKIYRRSGLPLWVSPTEAQGGLRRLGYAESVGIELRDWVSRVLSNAFALGFVAMQRGQYVKGVSKLNSEEARNRFNASLIKMGYHEANAMEISIWMADHLQGLYDKGAWYGRPQESTVGSATLVH